MVKFIFSFLFFGSCLSQTTVWKDSTNKLELSGYFDGYYSFFNQKNNNGISPYLYSSNRTNEMSINLTYIKATFTSERFTLNIAPGFGSYMDASYANEPFGLNNILEANISYKLFKNKSIYMDFGIFSSPFTNETAISKDHLTYSRSLSAENVPYFLSGAKATIPLNKKLKLMLYVVNGWQEIHDPNDGKAICTQLEYKKDSTFLLNWDTFAGNERSQFSPHFRTRFFSDLYFIYNHKKWNFTSCVYAGAQEYKTNGVFDYNFWHQANLISQYNVTSKVGIVGRLEYFSDPNLSISQSPYTGISGFDCGGASLGLNIKLASKLLFRLESRMMYSDREIFITKANTLSHNATWFTANVTAWF
jgi:hypothetical protein